MGGFILRRLMTSFVVMIGVTLLVFFTLRLSGDPVLLLLRAGNPSPEDIANLRHALKLDRPTYQQYFSFIGSAVRGDFGTSIRYKDAALDEVLARMPATLQLSVAAYLVALLIAIPAGILSATRRGGFVDFLSRFTSLIGVSFPGFFLGLVFILIFAVKLHWFPVSGRGEGASAGLKSLVLPAVTLGLGYSASLMRLLRSSMLEVLHQDYIRTARAKGLRGRIVVLRHALRNALIPFITVAGLQIGYLLSGSVIVENVYSWPGVGRLVVDSINQRDYPVVQASVVLLAGALVVINLLTDILYALVDPRIRFSD